MRFEEIELLIDTQELIRGRPFPAAKQDLALCFPTCLNAPASILQDSNKLAQDSTGEFVFIPDNMPVGYGEMPVSIRIKNWR